MEQFQTIMNAVKKADIITIIEAIALFALLQICGRLALKAANKFMAKTDNINSSLKVIIKNSIVLLTWVISILTAAGCLGININTFLALLSVVSVAISLSVQDILTNFAAGVIMLVTKPLNPGDFIESEGILGTVLTTGFITTELKHADGRIIFIPNNKLYSSKLINYTKTDRRRIDLKVGVSYNDPPQKVREAVFEATSRIKEIMTDPAPQVLLEEYADSCIYYLIWVWSTPGDYLNAKYQLNELLFTVFQERGLTFTYPHVNVHMVEDRTK